MGSNVFFTQRPEVTPTIYAYKLNGVDSHQGYIKVGYTERDVETRINEQLHTSAVPYTILLQASAMRSDGTCFTDHDVHAILRKKGFQQFNAGDDRNEWFKCSVDAVKAAIIAVRNGFCNSRTQSDYSVKDCSCDFLTG